MKNTEVKTLATKSKDGNFKVSQVVVVQPPKRDSIDISNYIKGLKSADKGKRNSLYDVYETIIKDPVVGEAIRKRVRHITNGGLTFKADNEEIDEMTDLIKTPEFRKLLRDIIMTRFFGKTVIELDFTDGIKVKMIPRKNLDTNKKIILKKIGEEEGISYENDDFLLNIGEDDDLGLLMEVAPYAIFKRNGGSDYAEFCELWGIPILAGLYDPEEEGAREEMETTFEKRGAGGSVVMSKNSDLKPINSEKQPGAVHDKFLEWLDEQILIGLIGQTMTTKDGSSRSQSETHAQTEDDINQDDRIYTIEILNYAFLPRLEKRGFPVKNGWFQYPEKDNLTLKEKIEIAEKVNKLTETGVDEDWWFETTGLPKSKTAKKKPAEEKGDDPEPEKKKPEEKKTSAKMKVTAKELNWLQRAKNFFGHAPQ
ncbi:DUF935 family protein [Chryseobacterium cucumeris]|uniref:phage portal protein family protein n=1 Tax=Chryseobacterium cucumeris TaxID=1813611 RepID=UPI00320AB147